MDNTKTSMVEKETETDTCMERLKDVNSACKSEARLHDTKSLDNREESMTAKKKKRQK